MQPDIPAQPAPPPLASSETGLALLATVRAEAPYRLPASLDPTRLQGIIAAKRSAAEDHIWSLREDPGYFAGVVLDIKNIGWNWSQILEDAGILCSSDIRKRGFGTGYLGTWFRMLIFC